MRFSKDNAIKHYKWGDNCDGWVYVDNDQLSVKQEQMPAGTAEALHYHKKAQQFFYIINGTATFELDGEILEVKSGNAFYIDAGKKHRILNKTTEPLEFILSSQPSTNNDRINL